MYYNLMNYNCEAVQVMMHGVDLICSMLYELTENVKSLPGCGKALEIKRYSANVQDDCAAVYEMLQKVADEVWEVNANTLNSEDDFYPYNLYDDEYNDEVRHYKVPYDTSELSMQTVFKIMDALLTAGKITVSADIHINEDKDNKDANDAEREDK